MTVEGKNAVSELIKTQKTIDKVLVQNGMRDAESRKLISEIRERGVKIAFADKSVLDKQCKSGRHQGFIAFVTDYEYADLYDMIENTRDKDCFFLVLDGIEDPHNLGSIIRVAECGGLDGIIIGKHRSASVTDTVMRISEGGANHVAIAKETNINNAIDALKEAGVWVYGLELGGGDLYKTNLKGRIAIVIGGEDTGINRLTKQKCDGVVTIQMHGKINSLNASVACGVAVFEALRQRNS
ncbi:MAG: 23S rRNA (guanosine(2251)-2'-O)-methyltransferase RlmB [Clostridia bacterium]|nr:23S rRNA (guanosine(2251)-2'-O)-methyltransferase RlmB [Clostridia bacterium]